MKECKICGVSKAEEDFYLVNGYRERRCYACRKEWQKEWSRLNRDKVAKYTRNWAENNPEKAKASWARSRAKRRCDMEGTVIDLTDDEWKITLNAFNNGCAVCGKKGDIHLDHFIPVSIGNGDTSMSNVIPLCAFHNISKSNNHPLIWLRSLPISEVPFVENIVEYLARINGMLPQEFEVYVSDKYYGISYDESFVDESYTEDLSLYDADNFVYDDDDWYLTMLEGRGGVDYE
ncbi:HNH endonuclease signature motif containing protein [Peribacillus frigoritolerans]|uniref:HNH endonuclease signature motif containing protein n=1 Tax=Peribacillus frigoritolerans TaxID=450367 RepID=UPI002E204EDA|nr:HNH endonuclease signature motif containing protein [Peribacillus frigoritolerans]MED3845540.1 HNH endonuclease signature motif containing protein [Peribacillus frigoritolerans]